MIEHDADCFCRRCEARRPPRDPLLTVAEAAELLGMTRHGVREAVSAGRLVAAEAGGPQPRDHGRFGESGLRFTRQAVLAYREERQRRLAAQLEKIPS